MFVLEIVKKGSIPSISVESTIDDCIALAKSLCDNEILTRWEEVGRCLKERTRWTDGTTTIKITGKRG